MAADASAPGARDPGSPAAPAGRRRRAPFPIRTRLATVRVRTTALATAVVAVALVAGGIALVVTLRITLTHGVERTARQQAQAAAEVVAAGGTPGLVSGSDDDAVAQVLDEEGRVVAESRAITEDVDADPTDPETSGEDEGEGENGDGEGGGGGATTEGGEPLAPGLAPGHQATVTLPGDGERFLAIAAAVPGADGTGEGRDGDNGTEAGEGTVVVAATLESVDESTGIVAGLLAAGIPALLVIVAATTWVVVGWALAPVDAIRAAADAVTPEDLGRRVPQPATGDEVARLAATVNRMLDGLEAAQARQRRFVADASHELRSPIAAIRQHSEVAQAHPDRATARALAAAVLPEALRLQGLVDDLLVLSRADEGALVTSVRPVDLDDIVLAEARRVTETTDLRVDASAVSAGPVAGDPDALARLVRNLVDNAARHAATAVTLRLGEEDGQVGAERVRLVVGDDGPGIPAAERERVFERFVRLDDARARDAGGSGLGLAIVAAIVAAHGGRVRVGEGPSGGAEVEVTLPARA